MDEASGPEPGLVCNHILPSKIQGRKSIRETDRSLHAFPLSARGKPVMRSRAVDAGQTPSRRPQRPQPHPAEGAQRPYPTPLRGGLPGEKIAEALYDGSTSLSPLLVARTVKDSYGHWGQIWNFFKTKRVADELLAHYERYPSRPGALGGWQASRDEVMDRVYEPTGADAKY